MNLQDNDYDHGPDVDDDPDDYDDRLMPPAQEEPDWDYIEMQRQAEEHSEAAHAGGDCDCPEPPRRTITLPLAPPRIVVLCGSTRFIDQFNHHRKVLTEEGVIVLSIEVVTTQAREDDPQHANPELKARLDELHKRKIDLADEVLVVSDKSGYFGDSTAAEIAYAVERGMWVTFTERAAAERAGRMGLVPYSSEPPF